MSKQPRRVRVLLVEDSPVDAELAQRVFERSNLANKLTIAKDGEAALSKMKGPGLLPELVILDLNLPKMSGHEVLKQLKSNPKWRHIPVIMLTTSARHEDVVRSYESGASAHVCKPLLFADYSKTLEAIYRFWSETAQLADVA